MISLLRFITFCLRIKQYNVKIDTIYDTVSYWHDVSNLVVKGPRVVKNNGLDYKVILAQLVPVHPLECVLERTEATKFENYPVTFYHLEKRTRLSDSYYYL